MGRRPSWELAEQPRFGVDLSDFLEPADDGTLRIDHDEGAGAESITDAEIDRPLVKVQ
jgi:hypothetical protein